MNNVEYVESNEMLLLAKKLQERYFPFIGNVDLDEVYFVEMIGFKPEKAPVWQMSGLTQQWARNLIESNSQPKNYCFAAWSESWSEFQQAKKEWIIFRSLYSISPSGNGKLRPFDVQEYGFIVEYFVRTGIGPYWQFEENLPSLLDGNDILPLILPMDDNE